MGVKILKFIVTIFILLVYESVAITEEDLFQSITEMNENKSWSLEILPKPENYLNTIVKRIDDTLNLTCILKMNDSLNENIRTFEENYDHDHVHKISWYLPNNPQNSKNRVTFEESTNSMMLIIENLKETDTGDYLCEAAFISLTNNSKRILDATLSASIKITVKPKKGSCSAESLFLCPSGECISKRFLCDGKIDCKSMDDESLEICGTYETCNGKLKCEDGRCIPHHHCCDRLTDLNCTVKVIPSCCRQTIQVSLDVSSYPPHYNDLGFLQTTIYTVIGCAMAFMFIITIMVIAICRVHLKRTSLAQNIGQADHDDSWGNIFLHSGNLPYTSSASGLLVTYNINNGVQFMGPLNPPPYSEISLQGPPPPYEYENLNIQPSCSSSRRNNLPIQINNESAEPLLYIDNNNGDINGNNTETVNVIANSCNLNESHNNSDNQQNQGTTLNTTSQQQ